MYATTLAREAETRIESHVAIGDGRSVALVDGGGAIDWLCWPRIDSDAIFASLLDAEDGGLFRIAPRSRARSSARYVDETNVAVTRFDDGATEMSLVDAMVIGPDGTHERTLEAEHEIVRILSCTRGAGPVDVVVDPRPGFGARRAARSIDRTGTVRFRDRGAVMMLRSSRRLSWQTRRDGALTASLLLRAGERLAFSLTYAADAPLVLSPLGDDGAALVRATTETWRTWAAKARYAGPYRDAVVRSALLLKLLCYPPSGAIVAAPTTSLPETRGAERNWDYRFCWLRDAAFTSRALFGLGYREEADAFVGWLLHATHLTRPELAVLYDVFGKRPPQERNVGLAGYGGARPVRVGNAAVSQRQLDVYGEVIDAVAQASVHGREPDSAELDLLSDLGAFVAENWRRSDHGIWEPRSGPKHHVHSRVLCWVALDRLLRLAHDGVLRLSAKTRDVFDRERAAIRSEVRTWGWSDAKDSYVTTLNGDALDAALLLLSWYGFEDPRSRRMRATFDAIDRELSVGRGLLRRNAEIADDGGFVACAFWAVEHLARGGGTIDEAKRRFETLLALAPERGLYGEIADATGAHLGNYPQGFSHLALVSAALAIADREREA